MSNFGFLCYCATCDLFLDSRLIAWTSKVMHLSIHILAGVIHKVDITDDKGKYYGCFNSILSVYRKISSSKNVILRTLMCLPGKSSNFMFLCSKYGVRSTATTPCPEKKVPLYFCL